MNHEVPQPRMTTRASGRGSGASGARAAARRQVSGWLVSSVSMWRPSAGDVVMLR